MSEQEINFFREDYLNKPDLRESRFGGSEAEWRYCREIILEPIDHDGKFLDLGCANGKLAFDIRKWSKEKNVELDVYGVDFVEELVNKAKARMPEIADHFTVADINTYIPSENFDYIRTELQHFNPSFTTDKLNEYLSWLNEGGKLIIAKYDNDENGQGFKNFVEYVESLSLGQFEILQNEATCLAVYKKQLIV